jgi:hypothetical protein
MVIVKSRLFGGDGGTLFNEPANPVARIERIVVHYSDCVNRLEFTYLLESGARLSESHGGPGGKESTEILLADDERICAVGVHCGQYVDSMTFVTYRMFNLVGMKHYGPYGGPGGQGHTVLSPNIREFMGRAGDRLDAIGFRGVEPLLVL